MLKINHYYYILVGRGRGRGGPPMGRGGPPMGRGGPPAAGSWNQRR